MQILNVNIKCKGFVSNFILFKIDFCIIVFYKEMNTFKEGNLQVIWTSDRNSVYITDDTKIIDFTKDKCFKLVRPEKNNFEDIVKIDGSRFSGKHGKPSAIFFLPWRESRKEWSTNGRLREYSMTSMFNNTIVEVEHP